MAARDADPAPARGRVAFFEALPLTERGHVDFSTVRGTQLLEPLFEFPGACAGCGETPYLKLVSQLFGDRMVVANATGCSSIYGGNLPTTPWAVNAEGRGPAWANSLFEDNAEFGLGMRLAADHQLAAARRLLEALRGSVGDELADALLDGAAAHRVRHPPAARARRRARRTAGGPRRSAGAPAGAAGRPAGAAQRVDHRRRRLGLRHRLGRPRSRARERA